MRTTTAPTPKPAPRAVEPGVGPAAPRSTCPGDGRRRRHAPPRRATPASQIGRRSALSEPPRRRARSRSRAARRSSRSPRSRATQRARCASRSGRIRKSTIRIYQHALQWSMYGVEPAAEQRADRDQAAAAVQGRLVARARRARRVPGGRRRRHRVHRQRPRHRPRARDADGSGRVAARHAAREDGVVARGRRRGRSSCTGWTATCGCSGASTAGFSGTTRSARPIESSPVVVGGDRRVRCLERDDDGARPPHAPRAMAALRSAARSPPPPRTRAATIYLGDYCGRLLALRAANGALRCRARSTAASTGRRRSPADASSSRARPAARSPPSRRAGAPLAPLDRGVRLLVAGGRRADACSSARTTASSTPSRRGPARTLWVRGTGGPISGAAVVVDGVAYAGSFAHRIVGVDAAAGRVRARLPARRVRARLRERAAAAAARVLAPLRRGRPVKRVAARARRGAVVLARRGARLAWYLHVKHAARDIEGSSTIEFVTTAAAAAAAEGARHRVADLRPRRRSGSRVAIGITLAPPFRRSGPSARRASSSFRRSSATGGSSSPATTAWCSRSARRTGSAPGSYVSHRCVAASPALDRHVVYMTFLNGPPCNRPPSPSLTGEVVAFAVGTGRVIWRRAIGPSEILAGRRRRERLRRRLGRERLGASPARRAGPLEERLGGQVKGGVAIVRQPPLRRGLLGPRLRARRTSGQGALEGVGAAAVRRPGPLLRDADGRLRPRLRRRDRREGVLVRRGEREAALVAVDRRLRLLVVGGVARPRLRRLLLATLLLLRRGDRRTMLWQFTANGPISGSPTVIAGRVYFATLAGTTYALDARDRLVSSGRSPTASIRPWSPTPTRLYLVGYGKVYGLEPSATLGTVTGAECARVGTRACSSPATHRAEAASKHAGVQVCNVVLR